MTDILNDSQPMELPLPQDGEQIWNEGNYYLLGAEIGEGYFGKVYGCTDRWSNDLVAKVLLPRERTQDEVRDQWEQELTNLLSLRHPKITYVHDWFEYRDMFYLIIERCQGDLRSLFTIPDFNGELWFPSLARDILQAVEFIHRFGYIHKDLHPGNVLTAYTRDRMVPSKTPVISFKVGDLGISRLESDVNVFHTMLAQWMLPPEAIDPNEFGLVARTVDIYHVGLVLLSVLLGHIPTFNREEILAGKPREMAEALPSRFAPAIATALRRHTESRPQSAGDLWEHIVGSMPQSMWPI